MCLHYVDERPEEPQEGIFWKFFTIDGRDCLCSPYLCTRCPGGRWLRAAAPIRHTDRYSNQIYPAGFHGYATQADAATSWLSWRGDTVLRACRYRGRVTIGREDGAKVIVADEMMVLPKNRQPKEQDNGE